MKTTSLKKVATKAEGKLQIRIEHHRIGFVGRDYVFLHSAIEWVNNEMQNIIDGTSEYLEGDFSVIIDNGQEYKYMYTLTYKDALLMRENNLWVK